MKGSVVHASPTATVQRKMVEMEGFHLLKYMCTTHLNHGDAMRRPVTLNATQRNTGGVNVPDA